MKEFDFRFPGVEPLRQPQRVRLLRNVLLETAGGFTEIPRTKLQDLIPGGGLGYIVSLPEGEGAAHLSYHLPELALRWGLPTPSLVEAARSPRREYAFFLLPKLANLDGHGRRRPLFSPERWAMIRAAAASRLSHPVELVYGEWRPRDAAAAPDRDLSYIFLFRLTASTDRAWFKRFILSHVFDGGLECDQEAVYLSVGGDASFIYQPGNGGEE